MNTPLSHKRRKKVAVVGAGLSGLVTAYRLAQAGFDVEIFEASKKAGGRVITDTSAFASQGQFCERGAEWIDSAHHEIIALAGELGLEIQDVAKTRKGTDLFYFDGHFYKPSDFLDYHEGETTRQGSFVRLAQYIARDRERAANDKVYEQGLDRTSLADYLQQACLETDTPQWVLNSIDVAYEGEFGVDSTKLSSLLLINQIGTDLNRPFEIYGPDQNESLRIRGGNSRLTEELKKKLNELDVPIYTGHKLTRIEYDRTRPQPVTLKFLEGKTESEFLPFDRIVVSIPFTRLREVRGLRSLLQQRVLSREKYDNIKQMQYGNIVKLMLGMNGRPWEIIPHANGNFRTDDAYLQNTWITSDGQDGEHSILTVLISGPVARRRKSDLVRECKESFAAMAGKPKTEIFNVNKAVHPWLEDQYARGSYSAYTLGQYTRRHVNDKPEMDGLMGFAGEHTDPEQYGYMNGAVRSGLKEAQRIIDIETGRSAARSRE